MDIAFILDKYFKGKEGVSIDVFDAQTLNAVYQDVVNAMTSHLDIEISVLQALSYCLYEMMDNVHIHSWWTVLAKNLFCIQVAIS